MLTFSEFSTPRGRESDHPILEIELKIWAIKLHERNKKFVIARIIARTMPELWLWLPVCDRELWSWLPELMPEQIARIIY